MRHTQEQMREQGANVHRGREGGREGKRHIKTDTANTFPEVPQLCCDETPPAASESIVLPEQTLQLFR